MKEGLGAKAKQKLESLATRIDKRMDEFWDEEVADKFGFNQRQKRLVIKMLKHAKEHSLRPAKRVRGAFVYYGYLLGEKVNKKIWKAVMGIELIHTALLMHDDFMDEDELRRGLPTTQKFFENGDKHYGESMAVNIGDEVLCIGYRLLAESKYQSKRVLSAIKQVMKGITQTAYGQAYDVTLVKEGKWTEKDVISLHKAKTALYTYQNPLYVGAMLAGLSGKVLKILHKYSMAGGVAFQLQDDILGIYGCEERTGKSADSDLLQGKCTLLALKTLENGSEKQKRDFLAVWGKKKASVRLIKLAKEAIRDSGAYEYSVKLAKRLARRAAKEAEKLRALQMNEEAVDYLQGIALYMVEREV